MPEGAEGGFEPLTRRFDDALLYAAEAHRNQARKGTTIPYLAHCLAVASLVLENGGTEDQAIAGLLHDVIEDCGFEHDTVIRNQYGSLVADVVLACSDSTLMAGEKQPPWRARKELYLEHLRLLPDGDPALLISACDKLHNLRSIEMEIELHGRSMWRKFNADFNDQRWYYTEVAQVLADRSDTPATWEVDRIVRRLFPTVG